MRLHRQHNHWQRNHWIVWFALLVASLWVSEVSITEAHAAAVDSSDIEVELRLDNRTDGPVAVLSSGALPGQTGFSHETPPILVVVRNGIQSVYQPGIRAPPQHSSF